MTDTRPVRDRARNEMWAAGYSTESIARILALPVIADALAAAAERDALRATVDRVRAQPQTPGCVGPDDNDSWKAYHSGWSTAMTVVSRALDGPESLDMDAAVNIAAYLGVTVEGLREAVARAAARALDGTAQDEPRPLLPPQALAQVFAVRLPHAEAMAAEVAADVAAAQGEPLTGDPRPAMNANAASSDRPTAQVHNPTKPAGDPRPETQR